MKKLRIDYNKCCWKGGRCGSCSCNEACEGCVEACPVRALKREDIVRIEHSKCIGCGACERACRYGAISLN